MTPIQEFTKKLINDILRDKDCEKYSITKTIALISFLILIIIVGISIYIMIQKQEIDYFLIGELMFFIMTLLGFKNLRATPQ
jgi:hypothetical protein